MYVKIAAAAAAIALVLTGCGGDEPAGSPSQQPSTPETSGSPETSETPTQAGPTGSWTPNPGQSEKIATTLSGQGFECTKHSDTASDLRMCAIAKSRGKEEFGGQPKIDGARLRFVADQQGTVIMAALQGEGEQFVKAAAEALLPPADASVLLADGTTLSWGTAVTENYVTYLRVQGFTEGYFPTFAPMVTTKEKALPMLQAAKLKCRFQQDLTGTNGPQSLVCTDPAFKTSVDSNAQAEVTVTDSGNGITAVFLKGQQAKKDNPRALRGLLPKVVGLDPSLGPIAAWAAGRLDGLPHSAYVGQWRVDISVVAAGLVNPDSATLSISHEKGDLGKQPS